MSSLASRNPLVSALSPAGATTLRRADRSGVDEQDVGTWTHRALRAPLLAQPQLVHGMVTAL